MSHIILDKDRLPVHVGIIMDGNGRWAQQRGLPRSSGHKEGLETARRILTAAAENGIRYVTLYTFSTENWKRTEEEVGFLMNLIATNLRAEVEYYLKDDIRLLHLGDMNGLPPKVQSELRDAMEKTKDKSKTTVVLAINYGARDEIVRAVKKLVHNQNTERAQNIGAALLDENKEPNAASLCTPASASDEMRAPITEDAIRAAFDIPDLPDVDLLIRTGGEKRLSNFLLWHAAYAELEFSDTLWPDYTQEEFLRSIYNFQKRNRRFGGVT